MVDEPHVVRGTSSLRVCRWCGLRSHFDLGVFDATFSFKRVSCEEIVVRDVMES